MNENSAVALSYGIFRKKELTAEARNVLFIDFGHSKTSAFVGSFTAEKCQLLSQVHEKNLGCRDLDWNVMKHFADKFKAEADCDVSKKEKPRLRLLDAIEKMRKILSANQEASINLEYLWEDLDLAETLKREDFEKLNTSVWDRFQQVMNDMKAALGEIDIQSVEILGGGSRIPLIQKIIKDTFGLECSRTLNSTECIARGCAMKAATYSTFQKVVEYKVDESNTYPIRCSWLFTDGSSDQIGMESDARNNIEK